MLGEGQFSSVPFEKRCEVAREALSRLRNDLGKIADNDIAHLQRKLEEFEKLISGKSEEVRAILLKIEAEGNKLISDASQNTMRITWDWGISVLRELYGSDAVDFALEAIALEEKKN